MNISGFSLEEALAKAIGSVKEKLSGLTFEIMCKVYSSNLLYELRLLHIPVHLINTLDFGSNYEHHFLLVPQHQEKRKYYLIDLFFHQFLKCPLSLYSLWKDGYQAVNDEDFYLYFQIVTNYKVEIFSVDDAFYGISPSNYKKSG